jgi:hypothetical protein
MSVKVFTFNTSKAKTTMWKMQGAVTVSVILSA